ncbi:ATP-binding cassette domain-containing protein [Staphylococcus pseudintermedius]|uniref:ABC transporter ATP-binding protein n=1 Tax=Staphylococcus pseudintermedius TaxID=283734 RepID=UPI0018E16509|nr:ABC transporter ATP-binding protein [Staphylococcus pseudintermedius]HEC2186095.1 ABC transporter ATP-binding protein [Staphylococcus delphini]EGQ2712990.1 ABC transporter ATP-binding protein [Staphylococcus pseudintermedius]EGQ2917816.1 ABC transporter ATP-binding protein [Staphylococcus pseudintermedius]EGQ3431557.1 ABC transporter ATP-binding protein [Staphylococcus pseudintermedius]EGQ3438906.1 ABC transporter ATP-binding protein [Staphylococcus pseudintermedius]
MLTVKNIQKNFEKSTSVLKDITIDFDENSINCIVGANGAGKTTLLNIVSGLILPSNGNIFWDGKSILENVSLRNKIFYVPVAPFFYEKLSAKDNLKLISNLYGKDVNLELIIQVLEEVGLKREDLKTPVQNFSTGMKQKLNFASMLLVDVPVILLDEPFNALDSITQSRFSKILKNLVGQKKTIIFTSHLPNTILDLSDNIYFLKRGTIVEKKRRDFFDRESLEIWLSDNQKEENQSEEE